VHTKKLYNELIAKHRKQPNYSALAAYFKGIRSPFPV